MKILITGMTGFVGSSITKQLFNTDHELIGIVRNKLDLPDEIIERYQIIRADISKELPAIDCDVVIHAAATVSEKILSFFLNKTNVDGTRNVLNAVPESAKVIFISSGSVYNITEELHHENEIINKGLLTPYGRSKLLAEELLKTEFPNRNIMILRPRAIYGKGDRVILPRLLKLYKKGKLRVPGDLDHKVSMTNIEYLCDVIHAVIEDDQYKNKTYNVVDPYEYNLGTNLLSLLNAVFKREVQLKSLNETLVRIFAGMRTVLVPGNQFTQTSIDYLTRDHVLSNAALEKDFPNITPVDYIEYLDTYVNWINNTGIHKIIEGNKRILWQ